MAKIILALEQVADRLPMTAAKSRYQVGSSASPLAKFCGSCQ
jgi:hypothetical protein